MMKFDAKLNAKHTLDILAALVPDSADIELVGTMFINGEGNDYDYVVCASPELGVPAAASHLEDHDFTLTSHDNTGKDGYPGDAFVTLRKGDINIMLTDDAGWAERFVAAARVCRYITDDLGVGLSRNERVAIHQIVRDGVDL